MTPGGTASEWVDGRDDAPEDVDVRRGLLVTSVVFVAVLLAGLVIPSGGSANGLSGLLVVVALTATGPSPSTVRMHTSDVLIFQNLDSVAHAVVFSDGSCSLNVSPGQPPGQLSDCFGFHVGSNAYTVDGAFSGAVDAVVPHWTLNLTARTHTIRLGSQLTLRGRLRFTNPIFGRKSCAFGYNPVVRVLARHERTSPFQRIAMLRQRLTRYSRSHGCTYAWRLKVRPGLRTTYLAYSNLRPESQKPLTSRPFTVKIRR
jgi:hypothetical protein